ncbi:hypothetical protein BC833DRAFT_592690 [Globomyces pollinis-pini]|nr:hypothetical protein BC833DRAFT_592690 [Globomyces pollinis-pini]
MFKNFFLIHRSGKTLYSKNFYGDKLDSSFIVVFASSVANFCKTLLKEEVREVTSVYGKIFIKEIGEFLLLCHTDVQAGSGIVQIIIKDLTELLEMIFGPEQYWDAEGRVFDVNGIHDLLSSMFSKNVYDPYVVTSGVNQCFVSSDITDQLDRLMGSLESQQCICGNGTMITVGNSVIHSRMSLHETRKILQYQTARPMGSAHVRFTPIFCNGAWHSLYTLRIQTFTLSILCFMEVPFSLIQSSVNLFESSLIQSRLEIPTEESPVLLRLFAKRETLCLLYHNIKTGNTLFPTLRPGPELQQQEILKEFWTSFAEASIHLKSPGVKEFSIVRDSYRFFAKSEGIHKIYLLLANESISTDGNQIAMDVLRSVRQHLPS